MTSPLREKPEKDHFPERPVRVWDLPTRLFHWLVVVLVVTSFITGKTGGNAMTLHMVSGYTLLALLLFRLIWGFAGGYHSRFAAFVRGPAALMRYAANLGRKDAPRFLGHNPLGGWSVLAMLAALLVQAWTGLFANDDIFIEGPLYPLVSRATSDFLTRAHKINEGLILFLVAVHILAILFYRVVKHDDLIMPMITGIKRWTGKAPPSSEGSLWAALLIAGGCGLAVYLIV